MTRKSKITKKELAAVLRESVFAPNKPGPLKIIVDVGDSRYYMQRALEFVVLSLQSPTPEQKQDYLGNAITLLGVAKHSLNSDIKSNIKIIDKSIAAVEAGQTKDITGLRITEQDGRARSPDKKEKLMDQKFAATGGQLPRIAGDPY